MTSARRLIVLLAAATAAFSAVAASGAGPTIEAVNKKGSGAYAEERHLWSPEQAFTTAGGAVTISNPSEIPHGVRWVSGPATPTCSSGVPVAGQPVSFGVKWSGSCTFSQPGTYTFYCTVHGPEMTGKVVVSAAGAAPLPASPLAGSAGEAVRVAANQRGKSVHGSLALSQSGAGAHLEVDLLAKSAALASAGSSAKVRVGKLVRAGLQPGTVSFAVPLSARARGALRRHGRLALDVRLTLTPSTGEAVTITRRVLLRP